MENIINDETEKRIVFHYNKAHNTDNKIPTWIIKHRGITYYVNHIESEIGFSTKETPENDHTKGSIQFKGKLQITKDNDVTTAFIRG